MLPKLFKWLLGEKLASSLWGLLLSTFTTTASVVIATGDTSKKSLITGVIGGALSSIAAAGGRAKGETSK